MPNDLIDPTPFLDPQPATIPVRPLRADHPSAILLPGAVAPADTPQPSDPKPPLATSGFSLIFQAGGQLRVYPITGAVTLMIEGKPPAATDPSVTPLEGGGYQLRVPADATLTLPSLPWLGVTMRISSKIGLRVRETPTTNGKEIVRLPEGTLLTFSSATQSDGTYLWRQVIAPEQYNGVKIKGYWMAERSLDGKQVFLLPA